MAFNPPLAVKRTFCLMDSGEMNQVGPAEIGVPRKKRELDRKKCRNCRNDKKKCTPQERPWPGEKCTRCQEQNLACSANKTKSEEEEERSAWLSPSPCTDNPHVPDTITRELLEERYLVSLLQEATSRMQSSIENWKQMFSSACEPVVMEKVGTLFKVTEEVVLKSAKRWSDQSGKDTEDFRLEEALLLPSVLHRKSKPDYGFLSSIFYNRPDSLRAFADRLYSKGDMETGDMLLDFLGGYAWRENPDEVKDDIKQLFLRRTQFAQRTEPVFSRLEAPLLEADIMRHIDPQWCQWIHPEAIPPGLLVAKDLTGQNILHHAAKSYSLDCFRNFHSNRDFLRAINTPDLLGRTPLHIACETRIEGRDLLFTELILGGANAKISANGGLTVLHFSAATGDVKVAKLILKETFRDLAGAPDDWNRLPIFYAAMNGHDQVVRLLLDSMWYNSTIEGPDPRDWLWRGGLDPRDWLCHVDCDGRSFVSWAAERGHVAVIKETMDWLVNRDYLSEALQLAFAQDRKSFTPNDYAARNGHHLVADILQQVNEKVQGGVSRIYLDPIVSF